MLDLRDETRSGSTILDAFRVYIYIYTININEHHVALTLLYICPIRFESPHLITNALWPQNFVGLGDDGPSRVIAGPLGGSTFLASPPYFESWRSTNPSLPSLSETFPSHCPSPCHHVFTFGVFSPQLSGSEETNAFNATGGKRIYVSKGSLNSESSNETIQLLGLPKPVISGKFSKGGVRLAGTGSVVMDDGSLLATAIVTFAGQCHLKYPSATSVIALRSTNGGKTWRFRATIAEAKDYPFSQEGPNEMDLVRLDDGGILAVVRLDGGDGPATHPYVNYFQTVSRDGGRTWSKLERTSAGCARPRLLRLGSTLILSGGRQRNSNTSDILLWTARVSGAALPVWGNVHSISFEHNRRMPNATLRFDANVNSTSYSPRETNSYTSLVRINASRGLITYDMHRKFEASFSMAFSI